MTHGSLFSGIGGFDLAAEWMGWENKFHCEWNDFGKRVLNYYWPQAISYGDITKTDFTVWRGRIDILTGGFPCQPYSTAGKRLGKADERHLWPEMLRAIREIQPRYIVGENVYGLINWNGGLVFNEVQTDLEAIGYQIQPVILPACSVNAPHRRERVWFVAYNTNSGIESLQSKREDTIYRFENVTNSTGERLERSTSRNSKLHSKFNKERLTFYTRCSEWKNWLYGQKQARQATKFGDSYTKFGRFVDFPTVEPTIRGGNDGIPRELDGITFPKWRNETIKAYGNAIVPQVAFQIFKAIGLHQASYGCR